MPTFRLALAAALCVAFLAACQEKSVSVPSDFITADSSEFAIKSVQKYQDPNGNTTDSMIVVIQVTYTNTDTRPEAISADKFSLLDPNLVGTYQAVTGGDISIPTMQTTMLDPGKPIALELGFRVPAAMGAARLVYQP